MTQHALRTFFGLACILCLGYGIAASSSRSAPLEHQQSFKTSHVYQSKTRSNNSLLAQQTQAPLHTRPPLPVPLPTNSSWSVPYQTPSARTATTSGMSSNAASPMLATSPIRVARFMRANDGHYYANTLINGNSLRMIIDTGATKIALSRGDARKVGYFLKDNDFSSVGEGVAGKVAMASITLNRLMLGDIVLSNVPAVVFNAESGPSLLGMNVLNQMHDISINNNSMIIKRRTMY